MKKTLTPNKSAYDSLKLANNTNLNKVLVLCHDATWHIVKHYDLINGPAVGPCLSEIQEQFNGWQGMMQTMGRKSFETLHKSFFPDVKLTKKTTTEELCVIIWNYRLSKAHDWTAATPSNPGDAKNPLQRKSAIAGRTYELITPSADAKKFTSPAGLACLKIIQDVCGESKVCTEGDLKAAVVQRGLEITKTHESDPTSAWRFLQFYRPLMVASELIVYKK